MMIRKRMPNVKHRALMLCTCRADMTSRGDFQWPKRGYVCAPDWDATPECGGGLHGLLWGCGDADYLSNSDTALWVVCVVDSRYVVDIGNKVKVPDAWVQFVGNCIEAINYICEHGYEDVFRRYA